MSSPRALRILITNMMLSGRSGAEIVTRDLALGLLQAGHRPTVYTRRIGAIAQELRARGIPVIDRVEDVQGPFDIIHGHHLNACLGVLARFPQTPAIFVCQDFLSWSDIAPKLPSIVRYVGISGLMAERMTQENGIDPGKTDIVLNGVDLDRFQPGPPPPATPRRALAFAKNLEHVRPIQEACAQRQIALDIIGPAVARTIEKPEDALPTYDLVFASALSAMESMACGRPTIVVDGRGLAGFVDETRYEIWRPENFGLKIMTRRPTAEGIRGELDRYDAAQAQAVSARLRAEAGLDQWIANYVAVYERAISEFKVPADSALAWAKHLETWAPTNAPEWPWMQERDQLIEQRDRAAMGVEATPLDAPLSFAPNGGAGRFVVLSGFSQVQPWGVWSTLNTPSARLRLPAAPNGLTLDLAYAAYVPGPDAPVDVSILANGELLARWTESGHAGWAPKARSFTLPGALCTGANLWLTFKTARAGAALMASLNGEKRLPGLGLISFTFRALQAGV